MDRSRSPRNLSDEARLLQRLEEVELPPGATDAERAAARAEAAAEVEAKAVHLELIFDSRSSARGTDIAPLLLWSWSRIDRWGIHRAVRRTAPGRTLIVGSPFGRLARHAAHRRRSTLAVAAVLLLLTALLLRARDDRPLEFIADYFSEVLNGTHVLLREYSFVSRCARDRCEERAQHPGRRRVRFHLRCR